MRRILLLGLLVLVVASGLVWWLLTREGGPSARTINLSVVAQKLYGAGPDGFIRIKQGDIVTLRITADEPMEIFLHGYDLEIKVEPGPASTAQFAAQILGRHALMVHSLGGGEGSHEDERRVEILLGLVDVSPRK